MLNESGTAKVPVRVPNYARLRSLALRSQDRVRMTSKYRFKKDQDDKMTKLRTALAHLVLPGKGGGLSKERGAGSKAPLSIAALGPDFGEKLAMAHLPSHSHS